jgi:hypothetical protein
LALAERQIVHPGRGEASGSDVVLLPDGSLRARWIVGVPRLEETVLNLAVEVAVGETAGQPVGEAVLVTGVEICLALMLAGALISGAIATIVWFRN